MWPQQIEQSFALISYLLASATEIAEMELNTHWGIQFTLLNISESQTEELPQKQERKNAFQREIAFLVKAQSALLPDVKLGQDHF